MFSQGFSKSFSVCCSVLAGLLFVAFKASAAPSGPIKTTKTLYAFPQPPNQPNSLIVASDGNVYGASAGGAAGFLYRVTPSGAFSIMHDFVGEAGGTPTALTLGRDGNLYGILSSNGSIFKSNLTGAVTILATLGSAAQPTCVFQGVDGDLYGTTVAGGSANQGSVFKITPAAQLTTVHNFAGDTAGYHPNEMIETTPGVFYGVCRNSQIGNTAIFKLTAAGAFAIVRDFNGTNDGDAANLVIAGDGNVYGSYLHFDGHVARHWIFRLTPTDELMPISNIGPSIYDVVVGGDGNLYVTSDYDTSTYSPGAISRVTLNGQVASLHGFTGGDDGNLATRLAAGPNHAIFGITFQGSTADKGTVYRVDATGQFATLLRFGTIGEGYAPDRAFLQVNDGSFYVATTLGGGGNYGTICHVTTAGVRTTLHEFGGDAGAYPSLLILGKDGRLYGASAGISGRGSLYRIETSGAFTMLHQFTDTDDGSQVTGLVASQDGNIYGVATSRDPKYGSFFRVTPSGTFSVVRMFGSNDSARLPLDLVEAKDGKLYGLSSLALFQIALDGTTTVIHYGFSSPPASLTTGADGNLYGITPGVFYAAHVVAPGTLWRCTPDGSFTELHSFNKADGLFYPSSLVLTASGDLYGTVGAAYPDSVIYRFTAGGVFEPVYKFGNAGRGLIQGIDRNLYGASGNFSGPLQGGALYKFIFGKPSAVNMATRLTIGTGDNVSIGGFIIEGNAAKKVMLRGIGPSLSLPDKLNDPMLELHDASGTIIGRNNNWRSTQTGGVVSGDQSAEIKASGLGPFDDREAALIATLVPGSYTTVLSGTQNTTGIGLVEVYDLDLEADSILANISTRGYVDTGDNVLIGGFITDGSSYGRSKVIVRAIGPSLAQFGVANALKNPWLEVYDQNGNALAVNDDWQDANEPEITSYGLAPINPLEAVVYLSLPAGNYTAVVTSPDGTTGVALVETYNLP